MYKTYWGMTVNPFSKELKVSDAFHSQDYLEGKKRYEYLKNVKGIGLFTGLSGTGKTFSQRCFVDSLKEWSHHVHLYKTTERLRKVT